MASVRKYMITRSEHIGWIQAKKGVSLVWMLLVLLQVGLCRDAVFSPGKYIAYEGEEAVFYCTVTVPDSSALGIVRIVADGEAVPLTVHEQIQRGILLSDHTAVNDTVCQWNVTVAATQTNSNITLGCVVFGYGLSERATSNIANFKVQGTLEPVSQLASVYYNDSNQIEILSWTAPPTLDVTDVNPDIIYRVCNNETNTCVNSTSTTYVLPNTCFTIEYSVSACNPVGCSHAENITIDFKFIKDPTMSSEFLCSSEEPKYMVQSKTSTSTDAPHIYPPSNTLATQTVSAVSTGPPTSANDDSSDLQVHTLAFTVLGALLSTILVLTSTIVVTAVIVIVRRKKSARIVLKENAAYETVVTRQRKQQNTFQMEPCPAYEEVKR